jgi:energy-converting hydrogenase Eha subunit A
MDLSPSTISTFSKTILATAIIYIPCLAFAKLALLMLYYRLLSTMRGWVYTIYVVAFIISGYSIALALALIFACRPIQKSWEPSITWGSCINRPGIYLATAVTNTFSDLALIVIPVRVIWRLRMRLVQKIGLIVMFGIGCL